ncbi:MAG: SOS response-associated peptidase [Candidatus Thiodiazotropha sp.]
MCGRFYLDAKTDELLALFGLISGPRLSPHYNIAPSQNILAVNDTQDGRRASQFRWGLVPFWAKQDKPGFHTINARIETVDRKPAFRTPFRSRRCLIPASGYFEWQPAPTGKQPYCIRLQAEPIMAFAGLYDRWTSPQGDAIDSCTIIVADACRELRSIHERMPAVLSPADFDAWLDPDNHDTGRLKKLLERRRDSDFQAYKVSTHVNSPRHDDPGCIQPL